MSAAIAIVGLGCVYPDASSPEALWQNVLAQRRAFRRIPAQRLLEADYFSADPGAPDRTYAFQAAVIEGFEFDRAAFQVVGSTYRSADLVHWLALEVASRALADAGFQGGQGLPKESTGVLLGNTLTGEFSRANVLRLRWPYVRRHLEAALAEEGWDASARERFVALMAERYLAPFPPVGEETLAGGLSNTIAGRICNHFDLNGGGYTVDGACSSSLLALSHACTALQSGDLDVALAGGVDLSLDPFELVGFAKTRALAPGAMRVYDTHSAGFIPGEGCGWAVLMREADARVTGRRIYAVIRGWGISSDGSGGITRPEVRGQILALNRAYRRAGFGAETVGYFEGHGTGTAVGDATELQALSEHRRASSHLAPPAAIGSVKANIGHTKAAAGIAGLIKAAWALHTRILPPTTGCEHPRAEVNGTQGNQLRVAGTPEPWIDTAPARAAVSSMGFGGINAHLVLEEADAPTARSRPPLNPRARSTPQDVEIFLWAGDDEAALRRHLESVLAFAAQLSQAEMSDLAGTLAQQPLEARFRIAIVASTPRELQSRLTEALNRLQLPFKEDLDPAAGILLGRPQRSARLGLLFPGQGAPAHLDGGIHARRFNTVRSLYDRVAFPSGAEATSTAVAQPAIATAAIAGLRILESLGLVADVAVGHSLGELVALHWAGVMDEAALLRLVTARGQAIANLHAPTGGMAAILAPDSEVRRLVNGGPVQLVGLNSPRQTVISGELAAVQRVTERARGSGIRSIRLPVSHAFHTALVAPATPALRSALQAEQFRPLERNVISTVTAHRIDPRDDVAELLCNQLTAPVRFAEALREASPVTLWFEVGPGRALAGLAAECGETPALALDVGGTSLAGLLHACGAAFVLGVPFRPAALFEDRFLRPFPLDWQPRFFGNPCETAPIITSSLNRVAVQETPTELPSPIARPTTETSDQNVLELLRQLIAEKTELPLTSIERPSRLLADLHLNSIAVGQLVGEAVRRLGLPPVSAPTDFANATVRTLSEALEELLRAGPAAAPAADVPDGLDAWVRAMTFEWIESAPPPGSPEPDFTEGPPCESWTVLAPEDDPLGAALRQMLSKRSDQGVVLCLPPGDDETQVRWLLQSSVAVLRLVGPAYFILVQTGRGAASFAKSVHLERPQLLTRVIHLDGNPPEVAHRILAETADPRPFVEVRFDEAGRRYEGRLAPLQSPLLEGSIGLGDQDVLLIPGGGRGIAAECGWALTRATGVRLALVGRSDPDQDEELRSNLRRLELANVPHGYVRADVTDAAAIRAAVLELEHNLGPITAILHAAGANEPKPLSELDAEAFRRTLAPKLDGARNVLAAVSADRLRLFLTFGSIIGRGGLVGQADYAVANEWLAELTETYALRHPGCRCRAIEWSIWSGVGMGVRLGRVEALRQRGISPITPDAGTQQLERLLRLAAMPTRVVVTGRFGVWPTLTYADPAWPNHRFIGTPHVRYPGIELVTDLAVSVETDPYLEEHVYHGERLLPAVVGMEAMVQVAMALVETDQKPRLTDLKFDHPVVIPRQGSRRIRLAALRAEDGGVEVALRCEETGFQVDHFRGTCRFESRAEPSDRAERSSQQGPNDAPLLTVDVTHDLYEQRLFHTGRFRRVVGYRALRGTGCLAELDGTPRRDWFALPLSPYLALGDCGVRDAAIHAIQACIPHSRLLPIAVQKVEFFEERDPSDGERLLLMAREVSSDDTTFDYDLELTDSVGRVRERWRGLRLRRVESLPQDQAWSVPLLANRLEHQLRSIRSSPATSVVLERGTGGEIAIQHALEESTPVLRRADGKPEVAGQRGVSVAHAEGLTLAIAAPGPVGCDLELVRDRSPEAWCDLLGTKGLDLARHLAGNGDFSTAATRVWAARESLKKSGVLPESPLMSAGTHPEGAVLLQGGDRTIATWVERVEGVSLPLVIAFAFPKTTKATGHPGLTENAAARRSFEYRMTVSFEETNVVGNVYFANFIRWQGRVREQFLCEAAPSILEDLQNGLELVTLAVECRFQSQLFALDQVLIRMRLSSLESKSARMEFEYFRVTPAGEESVATGSQEIGACRKTSGSRQSTPLPEGLRTALQRYL